MKINILNSQAVELSFERKTHNNIHKNRTLKLDYHIDYNPENKKEFSVIFEVNILHPNEFELKLKFVTWFITTEEITEEFKNSNYPNINAPAISYPFLRTFISTFTLISGFQPALIPVINFIEFNDKRINSGKKS